MRNVEAFVFPGQGGQKVGMGMELRRVHQIAQDTFDEAASVLHDFGWKQNLIDLCAKGPEDILNQTQFAQPAIVTASIVASRVLTLEREIPDVVTGHSLGEYSALICADSLSFADGIRLVATRGDLMRREGEKRAGKMAAIIGLEVAQVEELCSRLEVQCSGQSVQIANINSPSQIVISGDSEAVERAKEFVGEMTERKIRVIPLKVTIASHSRLMQGVQVGMAVALARANISSPKISYISATSADFETEPDRIKKLLIAQLTGRVLWIDTVRRMIDSATELARIGSTDLIIKEVGPGEVLTGLIRQIDPNVKVETAKV